MGKKLLYALPVLIFLGVIFSPDIMWYTAKKSFEKENRNKPWAPKTAFRSGEYFMRFMRYERALKVFKKCQKTWPKNDFGPICQYRIALCYAKMGDSEKAVKEYDIFLSTYPDSELVEMAKKGKTQAEANE